MGTSDVGGPKAPSVMEEHKTMKRTIQWLILASVIGSSTGCIVPIYSADPERRTRQLLVSSEDLRQFLDEWERLWFLDQPSHMTPFPTHGGVL